MDFAAGFYEKLLARGKETKKCGACMRIFDSDGEMIAFESYVSVGLLTIPSMGIERSLVNTFDTSDGLIKFPRPTITNSASIRSRTYLKKEPDTRKISKNGTLNWIV
jgi:hypothetical protein